MGNASSFNQVCKRGLVEIQLFTSGRIIVRKSLSYFGEHLNKTDNITIYGRLSQAAYEIAART